MDRSKFNPEARRGGPIPAQGGAWSVERARLVAQPWVWFSEITDSPKRGGRPYIRAELGPPRWGFGASDITLYPGLRDVRLELTPLHPGLV